jgi:putative selenium metabolism protein SsnA
MVCAHTHLYSTLARGMPAPPRVPCDFPEILELIWWKLDRALDEETIYWSALAGAIEAARAGTTCFYDHHSSPSCIRGSLDILRAAIGKAGLRASLCYEVTDRGGVGKRNEGIEENRAFLEWTQRQSGPRQFHALVGAHASFTLEDETLHACAELMRAYGAGLHIHVAEDLCDVEIARTRYGMGILERLSRLRALNEHTILAHGTHLSKSEIGRGLEAGSWFAHNPRSNMNNQVGYAPVTAFGERLLLGTDGIGGDMFEEVHFAFFKGRDERLDSGPGLWLKTLANNQCRASHDFGIDLSGLSPGAAADLIVTDYPCPTPLVSANIPWHLIFGMSSAYVESVMVAGQFVIRDRRSSLDMEYIREQCRKAGEKLWARVQQL